MTLLKRWWWSVMLVACMSRPLAAEPLSPKLAIAGVTTMAVGIGMMAPYGDEYRVFDQTLCVNTAQRSIDRGRCEQPTARVITAGKWVMGAGTALTVLGFWPVTPKVAIAPMVGPTATGVRGRVQW